MMTVVGHGLYDDRDGNNQIALLSAIKSRQTYAWFFWYWR